ncbi:MAG: flavodoxin family protein [Gammaproteobacteria bacterium]|nr:flavodoxin family protein [Gammaproteobacteria bacterium]MBT8443155.1 flavodoxin family protein [Gammaproteobacteria bacterium]NND37076.1 flavodoxin family protein [Gammaproteobacteria bacterium]
MAAQTRILAINGSYRDDGITDQALAVAVEALQSSGVDVETVLLREQHIEFCLNCRACTQEPGEKPGHCVLDDGMHGLIGKIEQADAYILAAPTNFGSVTAVFKRFMERLIVYGHWPWGTPAPKMRKAKAPKKKALLISSCAAPGFLGRLLYNTPKQLKIAAQTIGAEPVGMITTGLISQEADAKLPDKTRQRVKTLATRLT